MACVLAFCLLLGVLTQAFGAGLKVDVTAVAEEKAPWFVFCKDKRFREGQACCSSTSLACRLPNHYCLANIETYSFDSSGQIVIPIVVQKTVSIEQESPSFSFCSCMPCTRFQSVSYRLEITLPLAKNSPESVFVSEYRVHTQGMPQGCSGVTVCYESGRREQEVYKIRIDMKSFNAVVKAESDRKENTGGKKRSGKNAK
ncbi:hypothetical protein [Spongorhabdus nitratireducens]